MAGTLNLKVMRVRPVNSEDGYWAEIGRLKGSCEFFEEQGDGHGEVDAELQEAIEAILVPMVGAWEQSDVWFHNQDFYWDGVRQLTFRCGDFPWRTVGAMQGLLTDEASKFCISVHFAEDLGSTGRWVGSLAILEQDVVATPYALEMLKQYVAIET